MAKNNYDQWREDWKARFLTMDKAQLLQKLPCLTEIPGALQLLYLGKPYTLRLSDGQIIPPEGAPLSLYDEMNIYTHLWYAKEGAYLTGQWVPFEQLRDAGVFGPAFRQGNLMPFAATFTGHLDALRTALASLGGTPIAAGDVGYKLDIFPFIPMEVIFWEGDDEFPAQVNLLFDRSAPDFVHVESIVTMASEALIHLAREANLPVNSSII